MNVQLYYIIGVEGCGHHALTPAIHASFTDRMNMPGNTLEIHEEAIQLLNRSFADLWYREHESELQRDAVVRRITGIAQRLNVFAEQQASLQILIHDNSFPSVDHRAPHEQWDLAEMAQMLSPYVEMKFIGLYRNPIETTFSHYQWDGGLRGHARVIATYLEYLNDKLNEIDEYGVKILHYKDLVQRTDDLVAPMAEYLGIRKRNVRAGFSSIRASSKNWKNMLPPAEQAWITDFFQGRSKARWPFFLDRSRNFLP